MTNDTPHDHRSPDTAGAVAAPPPSRRRRAAVTAGTTALAVGLVAGTTLAIRAAAEEASRPPPSPVPVVEILHLEREDGHDTRRAYAARVEPAREALLSFEGGGTLVEVRVDEGDRIAAGAVLATLDTRLLGAKRDRLVAARAALDSDAELAALALGRQRTLENRGFAADEALDEARLTVARTRSRIDEADAAIALVDVELDKAVLRAPFDALVGERHLDPGATVSPGTPVLALLGTGAPRLRVGLPPARAATLDPERRYRFVSGGRDVPARLVAVRGDVDARTRTVSALFEPVGDAADTLLFGELLELVLTERVPGAVFDVPLAALAEDEQGLWSVLAVVGEGEARLRRVAVGIVHLDGERARVASASLEDGARIVADGSHRVVDGERVRIASGEAGVPAPADGAIPAHRVATGERGS